MHNRSNRRNSPEYDYEEEMIRLASDMSLVENFGEDFDDLLDWNPQNLDVTKETIRMFEEIVDEQLTVHFEEDMEKIAEWMIRAINARDDEQTLQRLHAEVVAFARQFPLPSDQPR